MALVYNVLKTMMQINTKVFDELTNSYKADKQRYSALPLYYVPPRLPVLY